MNVCFQVYLKIFRNDTCFKKQQLNKILQRSIQESDVSDVNDSYGRRFLSLYS